MIHEVYQLCKPDIEIRMLIADSYSFTMLWLAIVLLVHYKVTKMSLSDIYKDTIQAITNKS